MGLNCTHDAWDGAYSAFSRWRQKLAQVAGLPPLDLMEGFFDPANFGTLYFGQPSSELWDGKRAALHKLLPIEWACLRPSPLHELLNHSDCEGEIPAKRCAAIADALEVLIPLLPDEEGGGHIGNWREKTAQFVTGLRAAAAAGEPLGFH